MAKKIELGKLAGLIMIARPSAFIGTFLLWMLLTGVAVRVLKTPFGEAVVGGLVAVILHWVSELVHQSGHAWVARRTGYPMEGLLLWGVLSTSLYPRDEPELPAAIHIRRALGGPAGSLLLSLFAAAVMLGLRPPGGTPWRIGVFFFAENLLLFTLGALLPLGFTDGSTLLKWWKMR